ncbi:MAG: toll/interleukin-1 receptor domain-containing protein, partial [Anaerolineales bacterium]
MSDVFISYSRKDIAFARLLHNALDESELETWIDWQDIPPSADWLAEVYEAIEAADTFIFVI